MKLARTTLFVICTNDLGQAGRNYRQPPRPNATRTFDIRRPPSQLARWHVCRKRTGSNAPGRWRQRPPTTNYVVTQCGGGAGKRLAAF